MSKPRVKFQIWFQPATLSHGDRYAVAVTCKLGLINYGDWLYWNCEGTSENFSFDKLYKAQGILLNSLCHLLQENGVCLA